MASRLRSFAWGAFGAIVVLVALAIFAPLYSDYRSRAQAANMLAGAETLQQAIEARVAASQTLQGSGVGLKMPPAFFDAMVQQDGVIVLHNRNAFGQVIVLVSALDGSRVSWRCIGGSAQDVPVRCR